MINSAFLWNFIPLLADKLRIIWIFVAVFNTFLVGLLLLKVSFEMSEFACKTFIHESTKPDNYKNNHSPNCKCVGFSAYKL